ncbi:hypothetical protein ACFPOD_05745 [Nitratireductor kimnyeongensis]|uniref:Uncharacterized protein n=1 Tax=Nitratireductor kimnyeongensis TaxID=430679 RepID=A0ABW0T6T5_9HYPH|nr:hypothetical protein [Nitratireductor kimnyeongensis]QZZ34424.1 hypothetical protein KW403_11455 [Nitratireductor kimnyeongensis]
MQTDFASVHEHLEKIQAALTGSDPATQQLREAVGLLMDAALKAEYSARTSTCTVIPFPTMHRKQEGKSSRHG